MIQTQEQTMCSRKITRQPAETAKPAPNPAERFQRFHMAAYRNIVRPLFFHLEPEMAHHAAMWSLKAASSVPFATKGLSSVFDYHDPRLATRAFGLRFRNPVGLAAGYDKNGIALRELANLGFGHLEVGTVTAIPQDGNPGKRIFRLKEDQAVINRMGFPNQGADVILKRLVDVRKRGINSQIGVNIGKGRNTPLEDAVEDYWKLLEMFHPYADFFVLNVSSPNTKGLRQLQSKKALKELLTGLAGIWQAFRSRVPLLVKIAPDLSFEEIDDILDVLLEVEADGIVATNTALERMNLRTQQPERFEQGGLSGPPLCSRSTQIIRYIYGQVGNKLPIIGVGGVDSVDSALEKIQAGASLVQVYTGMIYQGPAIVSAINRGLARRVEELGVRNVSELVGTL